VRTRGAQPARRQCCAAHLLRGRHSAAPCYVRTGASCRISSGGASAACRRPAALHAGRGCGSLLRRGSSVPTVSTNLTLHSSARALRARAGCGNAFCGAFVAALQAGDGLAAAGAWGCVAASFMAEARGMPGGAPGAPALQAQAAARLARVLDSAVQVHL